VNALDTIQHRLGLGCARLGSVLSREEAGAPDFIHAAFDRGIRFFDTANIYGQGESERILGQALNGRRKQVTIVTKAGQYFPAWLRAAKPIKRIIAPYLRRSGAGRYVVSRAREAPLPQDFSDRSLRTSIECSLRRLNTDYADAFLLHSPPPDIIRNGDVIGSLERIRDEGKAIRIGISCENAESGLLALDDPRVEVIELPLWPMTEATERFLDRASRQAVVVIGRGMMSAAPPTSSGDRLASARTALACSFSRPEISRVLMGTTRLAHLEQLLALVESTETAPCS
jgi:aryl-alcohol dehydrogenase-like predicted oxidoreductase